MLFSDSHSGAFSQATQQRAANDLTVAKVLSNVRKSIGYGKLKKLKRGFIIEEVEAANVADAQVVRILMLGSGGEFREEAKPSNNRPLGFDGKYGWQVARTGFPTPMPQRLREKLLIPAWVRSGWWLSDDAPLVFAILPEETNDKQIALSMRLERGLVGAKIFVDRTTWLPTVLVVEYERGPYMLTFKEYQERIGFRFPQRITVKYRGSDSEYKVRSITEISKAKSNPFAAPPLPPDMTFDNNLPAELKVTQGVPFSDSSPGHKYVRPLIEGRDLGWFHFDTGADAMHIDTKFADELKMPILGKSQTRGADGKVQEVSVTYKIPIYLAMDLSERNAPPGEKRAGLWLGNSFALGMRNGVEREITRAFYTPLGDGTTRH